MNLIEEIKKQIDSEEYARNHLGFDVKNHRTYSLEKGGNQTCLQFFDNGCFYDYKTGLHGDVIDLCMHYKYGNDKSSAVKELASMLSLSYTKPKEGWSEYMDWQMHKIYKWNKEIKDNHVEYIKSRGIQEKMIDELKLGSNDDGLVIPYQKNGYCPYFITRSIEGKRYKKQKLDDFNEHIPWGLHTLNREQEILHITEGAFDAMTLDQAGFSVLSPITGHFPKHQIGNVLKIMSLFKKIIISFDGDNAGSAFTKKLSKILFENHIDFECCLLPDNMDVNDWWMKYRDLSFIEDAIDGLEYVGQIFESPKEFEHYVLRHARFHSPAEMERMIKDNKSLLKLATKPPSAKLISEEVNRKYVLRYHNTLGFYEYTKGCWIKRHDGTIDNYISKEYSYYSDGGRISSTLKVLKAENNSFEDYNNKLIFNFKNGILELDTGKFREHREDDNSTIQAGYNYDSSAKSKTWNNFLSDITSTDDSKMQLLKEYSGYALSPTNYLQKCLALIGSGSNGKSIFLDVITAIFGFENVTTIGMKGMTENFEKIYLKDSMLNLITEIKSDIHGAEEEFKKIAVGETITGCFKGKDLVRFRPRCKIIIAGNDYPIPKDDSDGFTRRMMFCTFENKFVETPIQDNELKMDHNIYNKLIKELPAIFNWVYDGYKEIIKNRYFTETSEQKDVMQSYKEMINPLIVFLNDTKEIQSGFISTKDLYQKYIEWCNENNKKHRLEYLSFSKKVSNTIKINFAGVIVKNRNSDEKGYEFESRF